MLAMYDEKEILLDYIESERYEAAQEAAQKAAQEATQEATQETVKKIAIQMLKMGKYSVDEIAQCVSGLSVEDVKKLQEELLQNV